MDPQNPHPPILMQLSILIVSRTASLLNRFLGSLNAACSVDPMQAEVLCSWNGSDEEAAQINNSSRYDFHIAQRTPYHFAGNINGLIQASNADALMIANDDLILDPGCVDAGLSTLKSRSEIGLVGAVLRTSEGLLSHGGIHFDTRGSAYHPLDQRVIAGDTQFEKTGPVPAVTGALQWIRRCDALAQPLNENYRVCGEDVELCLDIQQHLGKQVWLCSEAKAIHEAESTRTHQPGQAANSEDLLRLRSRYMDYIKHAKPEQLRQLLLNQQAENHQLRLLLDSRDETRARQQAEMARQAARMAQKLEHNAMALEDLLEERLRLKALLRRQQVAPAGRREG